MGFGRIVTGIFYVLKKEFPSDIIQQSFIECFKFIKVCSVGADDLRQAATRGWQDFEDCLISVCAERIKADFILTRDAKGFKQSPINSLSPQEFFAWVGSELKLTYDAVDPGE